MVSSLSDNSDEEFLDALLGVPLILNFKISRDSKYVAYTWENVHSNFDVFLVPTDGSRRPFCLTNTPEATFVTSFAFDSKSVIVGEDKNRNERVRLFEVWIDKPRQMTPLTQENPPFFLRGGQLHPNRKWLVYAANYDVKAKKEIEPTWVYRHNLETGKMLPLAKPKKPAWVYPQLNVQGTHILYNRKELHPMGVQFWLVDINGEEDREILNFGPKAKVKAVWLPDGRKVAFITQTKNGKTQKHYSLGIFDVETEEISWVVDDPRRNIELIYSPANSHHLVILEYEKARVKSSIIDLKTMKERRLPKIRCSLIPIGPVNREEWVGLYYSSTQPDEIVRFNLDSFEEENFKPLTHVWERTKLKREDLVPAEDFEWKSADNLTIHGWLYRSKLPSKKVVVYVHGGPTAHAEDSISPLVQYFVSRGFNVLAPNYRGSTGYGVEFEELIRRCGWGGDEQRDIWAGARALIKHGLAEQGKIGIIGVSYGGYSSWYAITKAPELFSAAVPICGMTDLTIDYETTRPDLRPYSEEMLGGSPEEVPERYFERSPINFIHQIKGRLLIVQGAQDPNVTPKNVEAVLEKLKEHNIKYELLIFQDEGHGIAKRDNQKTLLKRAADFFTKALEDT